MQARKVGGIHTHRPKEHVMDTQSDKIFSSQVPDEWIYRKINPDYGLDREIEGGAGLWLRSEEPSDRLQRNLDLCSLLRLSEDCNSRCPLACV